MKIEMKDSSLTSIFFRAHVLANEKNQHKQSLSNTPHNENELEKILNKSAFKEAKKQWKTLITDLDQA